MNLRNHRDLYPGDWRFFTPGIFEDEDFSGMGIFFRGMGYPTKKPPLEAEGPDKILYHRNTYRNVSKNELFYLLIWMVILTGKV